MVEPEPEKVTVLRWRQEATGGCAQGTGHRATGPQGTGHRATGHRPGGKWALAPTTFGSGRRLRILLLDHLVVACEYV